VFFLESCPVSKLAPKRKGHIETGATGKRLGVGKWVFYPCEIEAMRDRWWRIFRVFKRLRTLSSTKSKEPHQ
jgi:hypothetical protein